MPNSNSLERMKQALAISRINIEVKSGNAKYGGLQAAKDQAILDQYGIPTYLERIMLTVK